MVPAETSDPGAPSRENRVFAIYPEEGIRYPASGAASAIRVYIAYNLVG